MRGPDQEGRRAERGADRGAAGVKEGTGGGERGRGEEVVFVKSEKNMPAGFDGNLWRQFSLHACVMSRMAFLTTISIASVSNLKFVSALEKKKENLCICTLLAPFRAKKDPAKR